MYYINQINIETFKIYIHSDITLAHWRSTPFHFALLDLASISYTYYLSIIALPSIAHPYSSVEGMSIFLSQYPSANAQETRTKNTSPSDSLIAVMIIIPSLSIY